jgi:hypothetical protein
MKKMLNVETQSLPSRSSLSHLTLSSIFIKISKWRFLMKVIERKLEIRENPLMKRHDFVKMGKEIPFYFKHLLATLSKI